MSNLSTIRLKLECALPTLADQFDHDGMWLRHDIRNTIHLIGLILEHGSVEEDRITKVLARGYALFERVKTYANVNGLYLKIPSSEAAMTSTALHKSIDAMDNAYMPPAEVMPALLAAARGPEVPNDVETISEFPPEEPLTLTKKP